VKIDVDANEEAAGKSNIRTIPAFYFYRKGKLVGKVRYTDTPISAPRLPACLPPLILPLDGSISFRHPCVDI
jgi:hypothetical protein